MGNSILRGPGLFNLDINLLKRIPITGKILFPLQADDLSVTNTPQFGNPAAANLNIGSATFGTMANTLSGSFTGGARVIVLKADNVLTVTEFQTPEAHFPACHRKHRSLNLRRAFHQPPPGPGR